MKKALALLLVLVLALGMSTVAFAKQKMDKNSPSGAWIGDIKQAKQAAVAGTSSLDLGEFNPDGDGSKLTIQLNAAALNQEVGKTGDYRDPKYATAATLTSTEVSDSKLTAKFKASKGSAVLDDIEIKKDNTGANSRVQVSFVDPFKSNNTDGIDFEFKVYLIVDGKNWTNDGVTFTGTYKNKADEDYDADTDYYDFSDGNILKPSEFIRMFDGDMGEGVIVNMRGLKKAKYWGVANQDMSTADQELMIKYTTIDQVIHCPNIGIAAVANYVTLEDADPTAYVYDGDLNYLGRGNARLPFSETYYLAAAELDVDTDADAPDDLDEEEDYGDEEEDYTPGGNTNSGGDDLYPSNVNDNPGTGK